MLSKLINWGILSSFILNVLLITNIETASTLEGRTTEKTSKNRTGIEKKSFIENYEYKKEERVFVIKNNNLIPFSSTINLVHCNRNRFLHTFQCFAWQTGINVFLSH